MSLMLSLRARCFGVSLPFLSVLYTACRDAPSSALAKPGVRIVNTDDQSADARAYGFSPYPEVLATAHSPTLSTVEMIARLDSLHADALLTGDSSRAAVALSVVVWMHNKLGERQRMFAAYEDAVSTLPQNPEREAAFRIHQLRARIAARRQTSVEAWPWVELMDSIAQLAGTPLYTNKVALTRSILLRKEGKRAEALAAAEEARDLAHGSPYRYDRLNAYITLVNLYLQLDRPGVAQRYTDSLTAAIGPSGDAIYRFAAVRFRAEIAALDGDTDAALAIIDSAAAAMTGDYVAADNLNLLNLRADYLFDASRYGEAIGVLETIIAKQEPLDISSSEQYYEIGLAREAMGDTAAAYAAIERAYGTAVAQDNYGEAHEYAAELAERTQAAGELAAAMTWHQLAERYADSVATAEQRVATELLIYRDEAVARAAEAQTAREETAVVKRSNVLLGSLCAVLVLGLATGAYALRRRRRAGTARLEAAGADAELLRARLRDKNQELNVQALTLAQKSSLLESLRQELADARREARNGGGVDARRLGQIERAIANAPTSSEDWTTYVDTLNELRGGVFDRLRAAHPDLTVRDLRLAALLRAGMSTKEMAAALSISEAGVKKARYRLRKRLGLGGGGAVLAYLATLESERPTTPER